MKTPLDPELIKKIQEIESRKPENQQLQVLADIATMMQELINLADDDKETKESDVEQIGAVLLDIRESLKAIKDKEDPESDDYATPVVEAVSRLEKSFSDALKKIDIKPVVNVPKQDVKVAAPIVNVDAPRIDLSGIEKLLKNEVPKAFKEAIKLIPKTDVVIPEATDRWDEMFDWLKSIDKATRMKPIPGTMKVTNPDGSVISGGGGGTQYADGAARGTATGTLVMGDDGTNIQSVKVDSSGALITDTTISGDLPLPTGASTSDLQDDQISLLNQIKSAIASVASARGIAADLRVTILSGTVTTVGTVTNISQIGGLNATPLTQNISNQTAVQSNINNIVR